MPVLTVAQARHLRDQGRLDGRDVAVGGWFVEAFPPCAPMLGVYFSALEDYCLIASFADTQDEARICPGGACHLGHTDMAPWLLEDMLGAANGSGGLEPSPFPIVVIGHTDDPRAFHCLPSNLAQCKREFVADQVVWPLANGSDDAPDAWDCTYMRKVAPQMKMDDLSAVLGSDVQLLSAEPSTSECVAASDPRWNKTGPEVVWVVRSIPASPGDMDDPTRPVTVSLIDDASGQVVDSKPLGMAAEYKPARLWITATRHNVDPNDHVPYGAFYRAQQHDGSTIAETELGGIYGNRASLVAGPDVLVLDPGTYSISAWLAQRDSGFPRTSTPGPPIGECSTEVALNPGDDVLLDATFQQHAACHWSNEAQPSFGMP